MSLEKFRDPVGSGEALRLGEYLGMLPRRKKTSNQGQKSLACWEYGRALRKAFSRRTPNV
jgi:hypothetical protein